MANKDDGGWMPIETAPKDGSWFLVNDTRSRSAHPVRVATWYPENDFPKIKTPPFGDAKHSTHWMPLPAPPARRATGGGG